MPARTIRIIGDPVLYAVSEPVGEVDDTTISLIKDMVDTMKAHAGAGLAASQVGFNKRIVVIDCSEIPGGNPLPMEDDDQVLVLINPSLTLGSQKVRWREACLSVPGVSGHVERSDHVIVDCLNTSGDTCQLDLGWPLAGIVQHECDHLDGILYPQRMSQLSRKMLFKKLGRFRKKVEKAYKARMEHEQPASKSTRPRNMKAKKTRRQNSKAARVSRRASRSR